MNGPDERARKVERLCGTIGGGCSTLRLLAQSPDHEEITPSVLFFMADSLQAAIDELEALLEAQP